MKCDHCWFDCGPEKKHTMKLDRAKKYIYMAKKIPSIKWISFTGGEPFLFPNLLLKLVDYASNLDLYTEVVTNGFWGNRSEFTKQMLGELVDTGLNVLNLSVDDFHQQKIPLNNVLKCYIEAKKLKLKIIILCTVLKSSKININNIVNIFGQNEVQVLGRSRIRNPVAIAIESAAIPAGRGEFLPKGDLLKNYSTTEGSCYEVLRDIGINPEGEVLPCCNASANLLKMGNLKKKSLKNILDSAGNMPLFKILSTKGPEKIWNKQELSSQRFINKCHLCYKTIKDMIQSQSLDLFS